MSRDLPVKSTGWTPPFVQPLLKTLDRIQQREELTPKLLTRRAGEQLVTVLGPSAYPAESTFAHGAVGIAADHNMFFGGFAILLSIRDGTAVAIRESDEPTSRLAFEGDDTVWTFDATSGEFDDGDWPWWVRLVVAVMRDTPGLERQLDVLVVSSITSGAERSYGAALAVAARRATESLYPHGGSREGNHGSLTKNLETATESLWTNAYVIASDMASVGQMVLVDTQSGRYLAFPPPAADPAGWGLVDTGPPDRDLGDMLRTRKKLVEEITERLRKKHFHELTSLRDLEHKDLELAESCVSRGQRATLRYMVRENQRVHRLVVAARKGDWQLFGALLVMAHAAMRDELGATSKEADLVVSLAAEESVAGIYGARSVGVGGAVLIVGQPFIVPPFLDNVSRAVDEQFGIAANTVLL